MATLMSNAYIFSNQNTFDDHILSSEKYQNDVLCDKKMSIYKL